MAEISLVSINIERAKHYDLVFPFLKRINPDVVCFQELYERDIARFEAELVGTMLFSPGGLHPTDPPETGHAIEGVGILSRLPIVHHEAVYYLGSQHGARTDEPVTASHNRSVLFSLLEKDGTPFHIATTHFTWTPDGSASPEQHRDMDALLPILAEREPFVLSGDFNAPRGGEIFARLADRYTDHVPSQYTSSIDGAIHRAGALPLMVDGLFSAGGYSATDVRLESGVSDHCAIVATIRKG